jgi:hypothetical protein
MPQSRPTPGAARRPHSSPRGRRAATSTVLPRRAPAARALAEMPYALPELQYPARLNCAAELLDGRSARVGESACAAVRRRR